MGFQGGSVVKNLPASAMHENLQEISWRRKWQSAPVFLLGKIPWTEEPGGLQSMGRKESDMA